jgi:aryl-alcohol dehydrogenase-like predicted oxidoreductase
VLQDEGVAAAVVGAARPGQGSENVRASGVRLPADVLERIDQVLDGVVESDPATTAKNAPQQRVA